jgi:ribonuclease-3
MDFERIREIERLVEHTFTNKDLLVQALTTKSYAKEENDVNRLCKSQEAFRTHGDAILKEVLIDLLKEHNFNTQEQITDAKKQLENRVKLHEIFSSFKIPFEYFQKRKGEDESVPLYAETFESLIFAVYLDMIITTDVDSARTEIRKYIAKLFEPHIAKLSH